MLKSYKTEINPSDEQKHIIQKTIGTCRFVYNFYWLITKKFTKKKNSLCQDRFFKMAESCISQRTSRISVDKTGKQQISQTKYYERRKGV